MTPSGIEPATCRLVAQCLNQLCHRVPLIKLLANWNLLVDQKVFELMCVTDFCLAGFVPLRDIYRYSKGKLFRLSKLRTLCITVCIQLPHLHVLRVGGMEALAKWFLVNGGRIHQNRLATVAHSTCRYPRNKHCSSFTGEGCHSWHLQTILWMSLNTFNP